MTAKEMMEKCAEDLKGHDWHFATKELKDGRWMIDTSVHSECGYCSHYDVHLCFRKWDMRATYFIDLTAPEARRNAVSEFLMRVNWYKLYGKFTLDFSDGEICQELMVPEAQIEHAVGEAMTDVFHMMCENFDEVMPGIVAVISGAQTPAEAYEALRKKNDAPPPPAPTPDDGGKSPPAPLDGDAVPDPSVFEDESILDPPPLPESEGESAGNPPAGSLTQPSLFDPPASGRARTPTAPRAEESRYTLKGLNIQGKIPLPKIITAVKKFKARKAAGKEVPRLKILLSGDPGTGKTAFAKHLASQVGLPIRAVKVSDVISKWVGETEKGIAEVFKKAKEKGEILFLDECDSFLQSRAGADHSWEVTQVNELLQQMEEFDGVMIAATNFADNLDKAVLRRFTYKLKLDYLTDEGKGIFFRKYFKTKLTAAESERLNAIAKLTPGDFRTVREELFYLSDAPTNDERLTALEAESEAKGKDRATIGFAA